MLRVMLSYRHDVDFSPLAYSMPFEARCPSVIDSLMRTEAFNRAVIIYLTLSDVF